MTALRQTVCNVYLQSGHNGKSPEEALLLRSLRTGESYLAADALNYAGVFSTRRKNGSLQGFRRFLVGLRPYIALGEIRGRDFSRLRASSAARPFERQVDPVEQRLGI
jgi:hypothetical protein